MSLADYAGDYWSAGRFDFVVRKVRFFEANSGTPGVEFEVAAGSKTTGISFFLTEKAMKRLAFFAHCCGLTRAQMSAVDPFQQRGFNAFIGKSFVGTVDKGEPGKDGRRYFEIVETEPKEFGSPSLQQPPSKTEEDVPPQQPIEETTDYHDTEPEPDRSNYPNDGIPF